MKKTCLIFFFSLAHVFADPLFVSLGANCLPAGMLRYFGMRERAFPFDWMLTLDEAEFLEILNNDFQDFTNEQFLIRHPLEGYKLVHSKYHLEFSHDWDANNWDNMSRFHEGIEKLKEKYQRRVERFLQLTHFNGTVTFIRVLFPAHSNLSLYPQFYWFDYPFERNEEEFALSLYGALQRLFPRLKFTLLLIDKAAIQDKKAITENIALIHLTDLENHQAWESILKNLDFH